MELISLGKWLAMDEDIWTKQVDKKRLKSSDTIEILNTEQVQKFDVDKGFDLLKGQPMEGAIVLDVHNQKKKQGQQVREQCDYTPLKHQQQTLKPKLAKHMRMFLRFED